MIEPGASEKSADAYRTISEVAADLKLPQHVLRFWETRFSQVRPLKRAGGRRFYRPEDVDLLRAVKTLLYGDGYTIKGVQRILREQGPRAVAALAAAPSRRVAATRAATSGTAGPANDVTVPMSFAAARPDPPPSAVAPSTEARVGGSDHRIEGDVPRDAEARLRAVLTDLADCARLLDSVRPRPR